MTRAPFLSIAVLACGCADTSSGFTCPPTSFSSDDCRARLASSKCLDGGVTSSATADGGTQLCCNWYECTKDPYPELSGP